MLRILVISCFFFTIVEGSVALQKVKIGDRVEIHFSNNDKAIKREVPAGTQIWNFKGKHAGYFVDEKGEKIQLENYSNYESAPNSTLLVKVFGEADVGQYQKEPNRIIRRKSANGGSSGVAGPVLEFLV